MNKGAIKTFAIWARKKLMSDAANNAYLIGITEDGIEKPLPQSTEDIQYFDIGSGTPYALSKEGIAKRKKLVSTLNAEAKASDYATAYRNLLEHTASTWFNRLCAIRFMEVNDYFSDGLRVLSSVEEGKKDSDLMTSPFDSDLKFSEEERQQVVEWRLNNESEKLFGFLLQKKCTEFAEILPGLFAMKDEPSTLLINFSISDAEGVVHHLVNDIEEGDWKEQVQIIGWLYQFYNTEFKDETNSLLKKKGEVLTKDQIPSVTQLFTPEWIVKYMVENSLGRIWTDGHPDDELKSNWKYYLEEAEQEPEVQVQLEEIRKEYAGLNPEDISFIDPCMGSGHILCYAFDVLMQIYKSLGYTARDAVRSIIENNLYGLDIDERAYQLAYFSVMMKAKQYDGGAFRRGYTPKVYAFEESNGITERQLSIFGTDLNDMERNLATEQIRVLIETFRDAKEYGSILKVEPMDWDLLRCYISSYDIYGKLDLMEMEIGDLVKRLETLINIGDILSKKYWVTCTNPPYMSPTPVQRTIVDKEYKEAKADLYAVFMVRLAEMTNAKGLQAMITMHGWMFLSSFEKSRNKIINTSEILNMAHLGARAFDEIGGEVVQTTAFIIRKHYMNSYVSKYKRLISYNSEKDKEQAFLKTENDYCTCSDNFTQIPNQVIAYWISERYIDVFSGKQMSDYGNSCIGMRTGDNARFLRIWSEVSFPKVGLGFKSADVAQRSKCKWFPYCKGGSFRKWYGNNDYVVNWENDGFEIKENTKRVYPQLGDNLAWKISNEQYYFMPGLTWSGVGASIFGVRTYPKGMIFDSGANSFFVRDVSYYEYFAGLLNSSFINNTINIINPTINTGCGVVAMLPAKYDKTKANDVSEMVKCNVHISKTDWDAFENSWDFQCHPLISVIARNRMLFDDISNINLAECYTCWENECNERFDQLKANEEELNRIFIDIYGLQDELTPEVADEDVTVRKADLQRDVKSLISYAVGCMFGRYSLDLEGLAFAGGDWNDAFENNYRTFIPDDDNCIPITDENYFVDDIVGRFVEFIRVVYGENSLETNLQFIADAIGGKGDDARKVIRKYFLNDFFKDHCKTYSVTGSGKRPIYWLFDSGKQNGFKALVYMHRWTGGTIATVRARYVSKVQEKYENELRAIDLQMEHMSDLRQKASLEKRKEKILKQVDEIKQYDELIGHLALEHIDIDLDDGVKVNHEKVQHDRNGEKYAILAPIK